MSPIDNAITRRRESVPDLVRKEIAAAILALGALCLISAICDAPIAGPADLHGTPAQDIKAPWIFVGIQQLLRFMPPIVAGMLFPLAAFVLVAELPYATDGGSFGRLVLQLVFFGLTLGALLLTIWGYLA